MISWLDPCLEEFVVCLFPSVLLLMLGFGLLSIEIGVCCGDGVARSIAFSGPKKKKKGYNIIQIQCMFLFSLFVLQQETNKQTQTEYILHRFVFCCGKKTIKISHLLLLLVLIILIPLLLILLLVVLFLL